MFCFGARFREPERVKGLTPEGSTSSRLSGFFALNPDEGYNSYRARAGYENPPRGHEP